MTQNLEMLTVQIEIQPEREGASAELDSSTRQLLNEIKLDVEVQNATLKTQVAPPDTRSATAITIGVLTLALLPTVVGKLADLLISWIRRNPDKKVTIVVPARNSRVSIEYNPDKASREEIKRLISDAVGLSKPRKK